MRNWQLEQDLIESIAKGTVEILYQKDYGIENNSRYHVWIKARINVHKIEKALKKRGEDRQEKEVYTENIETSTIQFIPEYQGILRKKLTGAKLEFTMKDISGQASVFSSYIVRLACRHNYHLITREEEKEGKFYFDKPVMIPPNRMVRVELHANQWVTDNLNSMHRTLSTDEISLEIILEGEDLRWQPLKVSTAGSI